MNAMAILVTGGAGYIGSHMVHELVDSGERVVVLDNLSTGFDWAAAKGVPLVIGDTGDQNLVGQIIRDHKVESIIHFAASAIVPDSVQDPLGYYRNNTVNSRALIETAIKGGVRQLIDLRGLWQSGATAGHRGHAACTDLALWLVQADDGNHAARRWHSS
jgi:UDP-glucose 4-epimerase